MWCVLVSSPVHANQGREELSVDSPSYDGWIRHSLYVPMRDGNRIAVDYYRPTLRGQPHTEPLPVVWEHTPYHRHKLDKDGRVDNTILGPMAEGAEHLMRHGYIFASADVRGYGASFGKVDLWIGPQQIEDSHDITTWLASQSWSTGKVGMTGRSYLGTAQYLALANPSPPLKAIFAEMGGFDNYNIFYTNGIYRSDLALAWRLRGQQQDYLDPLAPGKFRANGVTPVDEDRDGSMLRNAVTEHRSNADLPDMVSQLRFRDDVSSGTKLRPHLDASPLHYLEQMASSEVAVFHRAGWFDMYARDALLLFKNLSNPQRIVIGPWYHGEIFGFDVDSARLAWFDYWLKGVENDVMDGPRVRYFVVGESATDGWHRAGTWPPDTVKSVKWRFGNTGSMQRSSSIHATEHPADRFTIDNDFSLGTTLERNNGLWPARLADCRNKKVSAWCYLESGYPDYNVDHAPQLPYISSPLPDALTLVGAGTVHLWITTEVDDADLFVMLEEVHPDGRIQHVAQGGLRASHRTLNEPPFDNFNLPWHGNYQVDEKKLTGELVELVINFPPTTNVFEQGNRIQITISGADTGSHTPSIKQEGAVLSVLAHRSFVELPILGIPD